MPVSMSLSSPMSLSARLSALRLSGARPIPNRAMTSASIPRRWQVIAGGGAIEAVQLIGEPALGGGGDLGQRGCALGAFARLRVGGRDLHAGLGRQFLDRVHEGQAAMVGEEADRVAMRAAAEAMVEMLVVVDREAGRLLVMERAAGLIFAAGADQLDRRGDDRGERGAAAQFVEPGGGEGHRSSLLAPRARAQPSRLFTFVSVW